MRIVSHTVTSKIGIKHYVLMYHLPFALRVARRVEVKKPDELK